LKKLDLKEGPNFFEGVVIWRRIHY
jgi:hypothetical protein